MVAASLASGCARSGRIGQQLLVDDVDEIVETCAAEALECEVIVEEGGSNHRARIAKVTSPNGVSVWFEGPNELA